MQEQTNKERSVQDGNLGRLENDDPKKKNSQDISHIDQQEGSMQHGQTGGNFNNEEQKQNASTKESEDHEKAEQDAPLKNTDKAFVKVNKDGSPEMQSSSTNKKTKS